VSVQGYSQKLPVLLDLLLDQLASFSVRPDRFAVMAEAAKREYANIAFQQVYQWAMYRAEVSQQWAASLCRLMCIDVH
jgi:secreted Zn-dependent insulinase-like peptidase